MAEFPEMKGVSLSNIKYVKKWYLFYNQTDIKSQQLVGQLPWGHDIAIMSKCKESKERFLLFSRLCVEERGLRGAGSGVNFFLLMYLMG